MAIKYLEEYAQKIEKRQIDQALQLLNEKRQAGEIRTVEEFTTRLNELVRDLTSTVLSPSLKPFEAEEEEAIDSETYNYMLDRIRDDFISAFEEANNIDEVQQSHRAILRDVVLKNIERGINELEAKLDVYEDRNEEDGGTTEFISSTFNDASANRTKRDIENYGAVFSDFRSGDIIEKDAIIEEIGDRLVLSKSADQEYSFKNIRQIFNSDYPQSQLLVQPTYTNIRNVIDRTEGTYWVQSLLFSSIQSYAKVRLELTLPVEKDINYILIEPITDKGIILESIEYQDSSYTNQYIHNTDLTCSTPIKKKFFRVRTKKIFVTFRNENGVPIDFSYEPNTPLFSQALGGEEDRSGAYSALDSILASATTKNIIGIVPTGAKEFSGYAYTFGIDNIRVGLSVYDTTSIYVSRCKTVKNEVGELFLKASETRPSASSVRGTPTNTSTTYDGSDSDFYFSSIEYLIVKRDYDEFGNIIQTHKLPIIPTDKTRIHHERLLLTEKSSSGALQNDIGQTLLFTDKTAGNVKVYRNGSLMTYNIDWYNNTSTAGKTPNSNEAMAFKIRIASPLVGDIYTVTYTPMTSSTRGLPKTFSAFTGSGVDIVDMKGDLSIRYCSDNKIILNRVNPKVVSTKIYLVVILRSNSARNAISPAVEDFKLYAGLKNTFENFRLNKIVAPSDRNRGGPLTVARPRRLGLFGVRF